MHILKKKGFTMIEMLTAMLLLGILMMSLSMIMSSLSTTSANVEASTEANVNSLSVLQAFQADSLTASNAKLVDGSLILTDMSTNTVRYDISAGKLYRQSRYLADVICGEFEVTDNSFSVNIVLDSHKTIKSAFYLKGVI